MLLRQSTLPAEDKKRILLEHEGELRYKPVVKSYRLLGSKFFSEFQSGRGSNKTKVYDVNMTETPDSETTDAHDRAFHAYAEDLDQDLDFEVIEALAAQEDADALTICAFESELEEFMQETPQMHAPRDAASPSRVASQRGSVPETESNFLLAYQGPTAENAEL